MSGFSSRNINDIKNLYESVVEEDATDVDEGFWRDRGADLRNASLNVANAVTSAGDAVVQGVQGKSIPADRRRIAKITNAAVRGTRDAILDFGQGLNTGKSTPKEELSLDGNLIAEAPAEGSSKVVNGKTYYWNGSRYVDASGNQPPASATPAPPKPQKTKAERATAERQALQVVQGGRAGYKSLMPKPTAQKGETAQAFDARMDRYNKSQQLAKNLTRQAQITAQKERLKNVGTPTPPPEPKNDGSRRPPSPPTPPRQPAPESPAVREYMRAAAAARKSGDTAQMAKVRDTGLDIWRKKYAGTLAKNVNPDGTQKGTGQSVMAKQAAELRALRPAATETGPQAQSALPGGAYSPAATSKMTDRTKNILGVKEQYDAYDLVLEYLISNGHANTLDEAHYVMMQMDGDHILNIIEDYQ